MKFTIIGEQRVPSPDPARARQLDTLVLFSVEGGANDAVVVAGVDPTDDQISEAVTKRLAARGERVGRTLEA